MADAAYRAVAARFPYFARHQKFHNPMHRHAIPFRRPSSRNECIQFLQSMFSSGVVLSEMRFLPDKFMFSSSMRFSEYCSTPDVSDTPDKEKRVKFACRAECLDGVLAWVRCVVLDRGLVDLGEFHMFQLPKTTDVCFLFESSTPLAVIRATTGDVPDCRRMGSTLGLLDANCDKAGDLQFCGPNPKIVFDGGWESYDGCNFASLHKWAASSLKK